MSEAPLYGSYIHGSPSQLVLQRVVTHQAFCPPLRFGIVFVSNLLLPRTPDTTYRPLVGTGVPRS